jgi:ankyrin repeat protein
MRRISVNLLTYACASAMLATATGCYSESEFMGYVEPEVSRMSKAELGSRLNEAAYRGFPRAVRFLLAHGAGVNYEENGETPLYEAAWWNHPDVAVILLDHGAGINKQRHGEGDTALSIASSDGHLEVVRLLLERGADINIANARGETPLSRAVVFRQERIVSLLLVRGADPNLADKGGMTPLHVATEFGDVGTTEMLLAHGANPNALSDGETPLVCAARAFVNRPNQSLRIMRLLLQHGADPNLSGGLALRWAKRSTDRRGWDLLVAAGAKT